MRRFSIIALFFTFLFYSCRQEQAGYDSGIVAVKLPESSSARAIAVDKYTKDAAAAYEITVSAGSYNETKSGGTGSLLVFDNVLTGYATVSGKAFKKDGVTVVANGSETVFVTTGATAECTLALKLQTFERPVRSVSVTSGTLVLCDGVPDSKEFNNFKWVSC